MLLAGIDPCFSCSDRMVTIHRRRGESTTLWTWDQLSANMELRPTTNEHITMRSRLLALLIFPGGLFLLAGGPDL